MFTVLYFTEKSIFYHLERVTDILIKVTQIDMSLNAEYFPLMGIYKIFIPFFVRVRSQKCNMKIIQGKSFNFLDKNR